jgi:hyperosmotically inducible periplasmic protein
MEPPKSTQEGNIMKNTIKSLLLVSALALPMAGFAADGDSLGTKVEDSVITTKVKAAFAKDKVVSATDISVETDSNGLVQLSGNAKSKAEAQKAEKIAKSIKGVTAVKNEIVVAN